MKLTFHCTSSDDIGEVEKPRSGGVRFVRIIADTVSVTESETVANGTADPV